MPRPITLAVKPSAVSELRERIETSRDVGEDGCWVWRGSNSNQGYAQLTHAGAGWLAHRISYAVFVGPIPDGLEIDHLCRVRNCVNPDHLEAVTRAENNRRSFSKSAMRARQTHCKRGHAFDEVNTYRASDGRRYCRICRAAYSKERNSRAR